jgi:hypothetical protein
LDGNSAGHKQGETQMTKTTTYALTTTEAAALASKVAAGASLTKKQIVADILLDAVEAAA